MKERRWKTAALVLSRRGPLRGRRTCEENLRRVRYVSATVAVLTSIDRDPGLCSRKFGELKNGDTGFSC